MLSITDGQGPEQLRIHHRGRGRHNITAGRYKEGLYNDDIWAWRANAIMNSQQLQLPAMELHKTRSVNRQSQMKVGPTEPYYSLLNHQPLMDSGRGAVIVFSCMPTNEHSKLQSILPGISIKNKSKIKDS